MAKLSLHIEVFKEDDQYVGLCPELKVSSFGDTPVEAEASTKEALEAFIEECARMGTLEQVLEEEGVPYLNFRLEERGVENGKGCKELVRYISL